MTDDNRKVINWIVVFSFVFIGLIIYGIYDQNKITCIQKPIPYQSLTINDPKIYPSQSYTKTFGKQGVSEVCNSKSEGVVSTITKISPTDEIQVNGTKEYMSLFELNEQINSKPSYRTGAICKDGTSSSATGSGACSHGTEVFHIGYTIKTART